MNRDDSIIDLQPLTLQETTKPATTDNVYIEGDNTAIPDTAGEATGIDTAEGSRQTALTEKGIAETGIAGGEADNRQVIEASKKDGGKGRSLSTPVNIKKRKRQKVWLAEYAKQCGGLMATEEATGISHNTFYYWLENDPEFVEQYERTLQRMKVVFEAEVWRRGIKGVDKPLSYKGQLTGDVIKEYSDNLAMFALKKLDPSYRDAGNLIGISAGGDVAVSFAEPEREASKLKQ